LPHEIFNPFLLDQPIPSAGTRDELVRQPAQGPQQGGSGLATFAVDLLAAGEGRGLAPGERFAVGGLRRGGGGGGRGAGVGGGGKVASAGSVSRWSTGVGYRSGAKSKGQLQSTRRVTWPIFLRIDGQDTGLPLSWPFRSFSGPTSTHLPSR